MATYRGNEVPVPDRLDEDLKLVGKKLSGMENVEEELNLPPSAEPDALRRPGQKGYMDTEPQTAPAFAQGGMVKHGSSTHVTCTKKG